MARDVKADVKAEVKVEEKVAEKKQEVKVEPKIEKKKKGKVISVRPHSIVVLGENGEGITLFGYKNVKIGDVVAY